MRGRGRDAAGPDPDGARPEFRRPVDHERLTGPRRVELEASERERTALARRLDLDRLERLTAEIALSPEPGGAIRARGGLWALVTRTCVVSLEPFSSEIEGDVRADYHPARAGGALAVDLSAYDVDALDEDEPEPLPDGPIDLGELVAQTLSLLLDPYPRAPGAVLADEVGAAPVALSSDEEEPVPGRADEGEDGEIGPDRTTSPFAVLAGLKARNDTGA